MTRRKVFDPATVQADFWRRRDVRVALTTRDVGRLFDLYLREHPDCTQTQVALLTQHDRSDISNWVRGVRQQRVSDIEVMVRIADGLEMPDSARIDLGLAPVGPSDSSGDRAPAGRVEIAVLPFEAIADEPDDLRHLLEGFRNHVVSELSRLPGTIVTTPASVDDVPPVASRFLLSGAAVRLGSEHLSLSLRLTEHTAPATDAPVTWSRSFVLDSGHLVDAYATIPAQIAETLGSTLERSPADERSRVGPDAESYENFLRAAHLIETNRLPDLLTALALLRQVVEVTPSFADGHALYGYAQWRAYFSGLAFAEVDSLTDALHHARQALALDPDSTWGRMTLVRLYWDLGRHEEAIAEGIRAVNDAPGSSEARIALARGVNNAGMAELALPLTEQILTLDEHNLTAQKLRVWNLLMAGRTADASRLGLEHHADHPADANTAWATTMALVLNNDPGTAQRVAEQSLRYDQSSAMLWLLLGYVQQRAGRADDARRTWERGIALVQQMTGPESRNFRVLAAVGNMQACIDRVDEATTIAAAIETDQPLNAYLVYRTAHIHAALGDVTSAVRLVDRARRSGFLSVQMLACEQRICALAALTDNEEHAAVVQALEDHVGVLRTHYSPIIQGLVGQ